MTDGNGRNVLTKAFLVRGMRLQRKNYVILTDYDDQNHDDHRDQDQPHLPEITLKYNMPDSDTWKRLQTERATLH